MKPIIRISIVSLILIMAFGSQSCKKEEPDPPASNSVPTKFTVDIPSSLSRNEMAGKDTKADTLNGNIIYYHLSTFIYAAEKSAEFVQQIMVAISVYNINHPMSFSYMSAEDSRIKNVVVIENSQFQGTTWQFQLTITDAQSETNPDGGKALQIFWNTNPVKGIAVLKVYNADRVNWVNYPETMYSVYYSEAGEGGYSNQMIVSLAEIPLEDPLDNPYSMSTMKMFAGKDVDNVDVFGNSDHPNAKFFTTQTGFNWAFVASCNHPLNIAVAEVGLPESTLNTSDRTVLLEDNSIKNVFTDQIYETWPTIDSASVATYLYNTDPPGYFDQNGFIQGGTAPTGNYGTIQSRMNLLSPYNPFQITNLTIEFKP
jgi:hypothetical protein